MALIETEDNGLGSQAGRLTALVSYGLLIVAPFTLGTLALAAMASPPRAWQASARQILSTRRPAGSDRKSW